MRLATAVTLVAGIASAAGPRVEELRLVELRRGSALVLRLSAPAPALGVTPVRAAGQLQRVHVDLPPGARLGKGVPRVVRGPGVIGRARVGVAGERLRLVLDVVGGDRLLVRKTEDARVFSVAVGAAARERQERGATPAPKPAARGAGEAASREPRRRSTPPARPPAGRPLRVVLDAGHGGDDPGAVGFVIEKHVTLDVVRRLARRLREHGADVVLTRSADATVPLAERIAIANGAAADLFVSVHANSNPRGRSRGIETYVLDDSDEAATLRLAAIENGTAVENVRVRPTDLRYILSSLVQGGKMPDSSRLASAVHAELVRHMRARYDGVADLGVKRGPFYVLVGSHVPCILVETSFVNHPVEGRRLADEAYRAALADGLARGIRRFVLDRPRRVTL